MTLFSALSAGQPSPVTEKYCAGCHNPASKAGGLTLSGLDFTKAANNPAIWEKVLRAAKTGQMPPPGLPRPDAATLSAFTRNLTVMLDQAAAAKPDPGSTKPHRLNRAEYSNAIRDVLGLDTDPGALLPVDESGNGFDNMADLLSISPALLERYLTVARRVSRQAIGDLKTAPEEVVYGSPVRSLRRAPDAMDLPLGAAGGIVFRHYFPLDAMYDLKINLGGGGGEGAPPTPYNIRLPIKAGMRQVAATFLRETARPEQATRTFGRAIPGMGAAAPPEKPAEMDLRIDGVSVKRWQVPQRGTAPEISILTVAGPHQPSGRGDTPSRTKIFVCRPSTPAEEDPCARTILTSLAKRAFRRPVTNTDVTPLLRFYTEGRATGGDFDEGIGNALQALLVSPDFLFRIERAPKGTVPGKAYPVDDYALASRLSFFLWSSVPDDELLKLADNGKLREPAVLKAQLRRMMDDSKSDALISNFGAQWLFLRTLAGTKPDPEIFTSFDENVRAGFQRETELYLTYLFRADRSVLELLDSNYTFLNQKLAEHYGVRNVYGSHFRRVELGDGRRGGLLGQGSVLTVTSYPNRTSVVQRGKWVLENLLGTPPPPPPPDIPELKAEGKEGKKLTLREAMEAHRANAVCRSCHSRMDPIGFALENFNGVGEWRDTDEGQPVDVKGRFPNGQEFDGPAGLKKLLATKHRDEFVETVTEKLLIYALGRGLEPADKPVVRAIARRAAAEDYKMSAFVAGIVESVPFQMRRLPEK